MMRFFDLWQRLLVWFQKRKSKPDAAPKEDGLPWGTVLPDKHPEKPLAEAEHAAILRFFERERRKHDRFVTPKGELPEREPRPRAATQELKPRTPKPEIEPEIEPGSDVLPTAVNGEQVIIDRHHEDGGTVLYKYAEILGEFNFRDTILDQLDRYFFYLKRMKKRDADAYHLYRQVGASLLPYLASGAWQRDTKTPMLRREHPPLPPKFNQLRPSFGCFAYGADPETEKYEKAGDHGKTTLWVPKFMYYHKYKMPPSTIQPMGGGDIYTLTIWWDRSDTYTHNKYGAPQQIPIYISADGNTILPLKVIETRWIHPRARSKKTRQHGVPDIPQRAWKYPSDYIEWASKDGDTVEHFLTGIFLDAITQAENSHMSMTRIAVAKGNMLAVFSINIRRTAYFFQDRDISVTESGTRKPIFHMVKPHVRKDGTAVKMHFRGLRDFTWAGYQVHISIPGLDHLDINDLDIGMVDEEFAGDDTFGTKKLGALLAEKMRKGRAA